MAAVSTKKLLFVTLVVDIIDIVINTAVAIITGSAVMLTEALQGVVDMQSIVLLTIGHKQSHKRASRIHPFGRGKELYFWTTMATFIMLGITSVFSFIFGWRQFRDPEHLDSLWIALVVLVISLITNGYAARLSFIKLLDGQKLSKLKHVFFSSNDIIAKTTIVLDLNGFLMGVIGIVSLYLAYRTGDSRLDGLGAMAIGVLLAFMSIILLGNLRKLVVGQSADIKTEQSIINTVMQHPAISQVVDLKTMVLGTDVTLITLGVQFKTGESGSHVARIIDSIEAKIAAAIHGKTYIYIEPE